MGSFYSRLSYSFGNEDWNTEHKALQLQPNDSVLCVTASGDRPLNLLTKEVKEVVTVDANPLQNALFDLKRVALKTLPYADYLKFIGVNPSPNRYETFARLEHHLDPMASALWELLPKKIERGVLYEGAVEKWLKRVSGFLRPVCGKKIDTLFAFDILEDQKVFVKKHWHTLFWKNAFRFALHPWITKVFFKDPGLYEYVDPNIHTGTHIYERLHFFLDRFLAKESVLMSLVFKGEVNKNHFPPYLTEEGVLEIKKRVDRVRFHTADLITFLEKSDYNYFDCFSVSDVASYLSEDEFIRLVEGIYATAKPGARFCIRQFLSNHQIPSHLAPAFKRDLALEKELEEEDRCFVYRFTVGTIEKPLS